MLEYWYIKRGLFVNGSQQQGLAWKRGDWVIHKSLVILYCIDPLALFVCPVNRWSAMKRRVGHFRIVFCLGVKTTLRAKPLHMEIIFSYRFIFMQIKPFSSEKLCTKTLSETEAQGNLEIAFWFVLSAVRILLFEPLRSNLSRINLSNFRELLFQFITKNNNGHERAKLRSCPKFFPRRAS